MSTFDTRTNQVLGEVAAGVDPHWSAPGSGHRYVLVANSGSSTVSVVALDC
ncbi:hypothetical protein AB0I60_01415 [Actinosynnema sp. NPDC050436]|uniref:hypothetical protein n=1 Tax=Actinosynnema sp. NPDC050436 TaxID=3155659 RepID=UPI0033D80AB7